MPRTIVRILLIFTLSTAVLGRVPPATRALTEPMVIATTSFGPPDTRPRTDGETIVWQELRSEPAGYERDVKAADLATRQVRTIASFSGSGDAHPGVSGEIVVWSENGNVVGLNLTTGQRLDIASTAALEGAAVIDGRWAVWLSWIGETWAIVARDVAVMSAPVVLVERTVSAPPQQGPHPTLVYRMSGPRVSGERVVWLESTMYDSRVNQRYDWQLYTCQISACEPRIIAEGRQTPADSMPGPYDLAGDTVVYAAHSQVVAIDLISGSAQVLATGRGTFGSATTDGRFVYWTRNQLGDPEARCACSDLWGHDLATGSAFAVVMDDGVNLWPNTRGGLLVWSQGSSAPTILAALVAATLPTARQPDPGTTDANWTYYPETGHYLAHGFNASWQQSGGLPIFGYPLTEEFTEHGLTVQYFERQRFEYHPEYAGTPYEVELGHLGSEDALRRGLVSEPAFQGGPIPGFDPGPTCYFFSTTGFLVCGDVLQFWRSHGLEFGDPSVSFRESLALFGYPISRSFVDPASGLTVQYFERARFEYHPGNPEPYRVLLGRLGADALAEREW